MTSTLSIIQINNKTMYTFNGSTKDLASVLTSIALRNEIIAEAITRAAVEIDIKKQVDHRLIEMTQG